MNCVKLHHDKLVCNASLFISSVCFIIFIENIPPMLVVNKLFFYIL